MPGTLIFDWDGTLHETKPLYGQAFRRAYAWLVAEGYAPPRLYEDDEIACYLGMNAPDMWKSFMPQLPTAVWQAASDRIGQELIAQIQQGRARLFPGAEETLALLRDRGYRLVFLSNCKRAYMLAHCQAFGLEQYFHGFYCCQDFDFAPKTEIFPHIARQFPGPYCVIGDRAGDLAVGLHWGFPGIACTYGYGNPGEWAGASCLLGELKELPALLEQLFPPHRSAL